MRQVTAPVPRPPADIAVASMSTTWNDGEGWEDALIDAHGVEPDRESIAYYRELWNAT